MVRVCGNTETAIEIHNFQGHKISVISVTFLHDRRYLTSESEDGVWKRAPSYNPRS